MALVVVSALLPCATLAQGASAPRVPRHFAEISEGLPEEAVTAVAYDPGDPEVLFAGLDGFLFKSDDNGGTWRPVLSFPRGLSIDAEMALQDRAANQAIDGDGARLPDLRAGDESVAGAEEIDLEEADDVEELEELEEQLEDQALFDDAAPLDPADADPLGEMPTLPSGDADLLATFPREEPGVRAIRFVAPTSRTVFVATPRGLFRSVDGGETFAQLELPGGALMNDIRDVAVDPLHSSRLYIATADGTLISADNGATFTRAPDLLGNAPGLAVIARRVNDQDLVILGTERGVWRSWDAGTTFREMLLKGVSAFEGVGAVAFDERTAITYAGTLQGLFAGERESSLLEPRRALFGDPVFAISIDPTRDRGVAVGLGGRGVAHSDDTGITLVDLPDALPATTAFALARPSDEPDAIVAATERGVFRFVKGTGIRVSEDRLQGLVRRWKREPSLQETADAAIAFSRLDPGYLAGVSRRARWAPLLPELRLHFRYKRGRPEVDEYVVVIDDPDAFDEDDAEEIIDLARDGILVNAPSRGVTWDVYALATWNLDDIVYNPAELVAARQRPALFRARESLYNRVESLYTSRRRLMAEVYLSPAGKRPAEQARALLRLAELTSLLAALTGGAFVDLADARGATLPELAGSFDLGAPADEPPVGLARANRNAVAPSGERSRSLPNPRRR